MSHGCLHLRSNIKLFGVCAFLLLISNPKLVVYGSGDDQQEPLSINLKSRAVVIGPTITLGEIGQVMVPDTVKKSQLAAVRIAKAPPPGESTDISLSSIKRRLKITGFEDYLPFLSGPRVIRVTTAQVEIDKAFVRENFAKCEILGIQRGLAGLKQT